VLHKLAENQNRVIHKSFCHNKDAEEYLLVAQAATGSYFCHNKDAENELFAAHAAAGSYFCQSRQK